MKKSGLIIPLLLLTLLSISSCSFLERKKNTMSDEKELQEIATELKVVLKDKKDITLIMLYAKEEMSSNLETVEVEYKDDKESSVSETYLYNTGIWQEPEAVKAPSKPTYFTINDVNLDLVSPAYKTACEKIIIGEKFEKDKIFYLNKIYIAKDEMSLYIHTTAGKTEYYEFDVTVKKDGSVSYRAR